MKKMIVAICIVALVVNACFAVFGYRSENDDGDGNATKEGEFKIGEGKSVKVGDATHILTVVSIVENSVKIRIESDPVEVELTLAYPELVDTDDDGFYDLELNITDIDIKNNIVKIDLTPVHIKIGGNEDVKFSVDMPEKKIGDSYRYDFTIYAQIYWENKTTGNYSEYTLNGNGQWDDMMQGPVNAETGFADEHSCLLERQDLDGTFTVTLDSTDTGKVKVGGTFSADNNQYTEFVEKRVIKSDNHGKLKVDKLPKATVPIPIEYEADLRYYPDPDEDPMATLDEEIYLGKKITEGDEDSFFFQGSSEWAGGYYNWSAEDVENVLDMQCLRINITSKFFQWLDFKKLVWISEETSFPVKEFLRTNQSHEDNETLFWIILEETKVLQKGYSRGQTDIPWATSGEAEFPDLHPAGEYEEWDKIPNGGHMFQGDPLEEEKTVQVAPEDALQFAMDNSEELGDYMNMYRNAYVTKAKYNATLEDIIHDPQQKAGSYLWNLTLADYMTDEEAREYREEHGNDDDDDDDDEKDRSEWPEREYTLTVARNLTKKVNPLQPYSATTEIFKDLGVNGGWSNFRRSVLDPEGCTLSGGVDIMHQDDEAKKEFFDRDDEFIVKDLSIHIGEGGTASEMPGAEIIQLITGITMPHSRYAWTFQKASVYETGDTFIVGIDVETGRMIYVTKVSGNEIMGLFA